MNHADVRNDGTARAPRQQVTPIGIPLEAKFLWEAAVIQRHVAEGVVGTMEPGRQRGLRGRCGGKSSGCCV